MKRYLKSLLLFVFTILLIIQTHSFNSANELQCSTSSTGQKTTHYQGSILVYGEGYEKIGQTVIRAKKNGIQSIYELIILKNSTNYRIHAVGSELEIFVQQYNSSVKSDYLDVFEHIIFIKEFSHSSLDFNYVALFFDTSNVESPSLKRISIDSLKFPTYDSRNGIEFSKILEWNEIENTLYVVMGNDIRTQIHKKVLDLDGPFNSYIFVGNFKSHFTIGNHNFIFDDSTKKYYQFVNENSPYQILEAKKSPSDQNFGVLLTENLRFFKMVNYNFAITSHTAKSGKIQSSYGFYNDKKLMVSQTDNQGTIVPIVHFNKYNFVYISTNSFSLCRYNSRGQFQTQSFSSLVSAQEDLSEAKSDYLNALKVTFSIQKQFILLSNSIIIYELQTFVNNSSMSLNKFAKISLTSDIKTALSEKTSVFINMEIKCLCAKMVVSKLKCFSSSFKCLAINSYVKENCTTQYVDAVPEFL